MQGGIRAKICGLTEPDHVEAACAGGAAYVGFVFFPKSPRHLGAERARELAQGVPPGICKVGLIVNAEDAAIDALLSTVPLDMLQLHGSEPPQRVAAVRARFGLPVMKAVGIAGTEDLPALEAHADAADQLLVDAKPPAAAVLPGGNGLSFDWRLIAARRWSVPWMLAGGLTEATLAEAVALTGARQVDVSSGVEDAPGRKSPELIRRFLAACGATPARSAQPEGALPPRL